MYLPNLLLYSHRLEVIKKLKSDLLNFAKGDGPKINPNEILQGLYQPRRNILDRYKIRNSPQNLNSTYSTLNQNNSNAINKSAFRQSDFKKKSHFKSGGIGSGGEVL